jgi:hypothetical protein
VRSPVQGKVRRPRLRPVGTPEPLQAWHFRPEHPLDGVRRFTRPCTYVAHLAMTGVRSYNVPNIIYIKNKTVYQCWWSPRAITTSKMAITASVVIGHIVIRPNQPQKLIRIVQ